MNPVKLIKTLLFTLSGLTLTSHAGLLREAPDACAVSAPAYLGSSDYQLRYTGACKDGLAHGQGSAVWTLVNSPAHKLKWEGNFYQGVYLPPPAGVVSAKPIGRGEEILFELGALPAQPGIPAARLHVLATANLTNYPDPCKPRGLWVSNAPVAALVQESSSDTLLRAAVNKLKAHCGKALELTGKRGDDKPFIEVRILSAEQVQADKYGNLPGAVVDAFVPMNGGPLERYTNQAASQQRLMQAKDQDLQIRQATAQKLKDFFNKQHASGWAAFSDIAQNPFRYADQVVVTSASLKSVLTPARALLETNTSGAYAQAILDGNGVAKWEPGARLLAVRVLGRSTEADYKGLAMLQLVGSERCLQPACDDWLLLPKALQNGQQP